MSTQPDPSHIMQMGFGFWPSKVLLSAVRLGLFTFLGEGTKRTGEIRKHLGLQTSTRHVCDWLDALVSLGFLSREGLMEGAGDAEGATRILSSLLERARHEYVSPYDLAIAFTGIGDRASALDQLEQAFAQRVMRIVALADPEFDALATERRYRRLAERLRLPVGSARTPADR